MKIIYMHHAQRDKSNRDKKTLEERQLEDITENGIKEAEILAEMIKNNKKIVAIYTSPYKRCMHTANIINKYLKVPIIEDVRFNEMKREEEWKDLLIRNIEAIDDIVKKYNEEDEVICVTSGVNLSAFICYFYNIEPTNETPWAQGVSCSPINFVTDKSNLD